MSDWTEYKLGELIKLKYGKDHKPLQDGIIPAYGSGGIMRFVNQAIYKGPSILIPRKGSLNNVIYINTPFWTVDTMFWSIINEEIVDSRFLYYAICKYNFEDLNVGSAIPSLTVPVIEAVRVKLPTKEIQTRIADIIDSVNEKIDTNRKINARLEELAQAIFKSWFIDFEPFGGKMPEDWANFKVGEVSTINERQYSLHENWTDFQYLDTGNITENIIGKLYKFSNNNDLPSRARRKVKEFDIIYSTVRPNQRHFGLILNPDKNWLVSTGFAVISAKQSYINSFYLYMVISQKKVSEYLQSLGEQATSTYPSVNATDIANLEIMVPDLELQNQFGLIISKIFQLKNTLEQESSRLAALRDTLLPKLMSGELLPE